MHLFSMEGFPRKHIKHCFSLDTLNKQMSAHFQEREYNNDKSGV